MKLFAKNSLLVRTAILLALMTTLHAQNLRKNKASLIFLLGTPAGDEVHKKFDLSQLPAGVTIGEAEEYLLQSSDAEDLNIAPVEFQYDDGPQEQGTLPKQCGAFFVKANGKSHYVPIVGPDYATHDMCEKIVAIGAMTDLGPRPRLIFIFELDNVHGTYYNLPYILAWNKVAEAYEVDSQTSDWLADQNKRDTIAQVRRQLAHHTRHNSEAQHPCTKRPELKFGHAPSPMGVAVDGSGNVYALDSLTSEVKKIPAGCTSSSCMITLGGSFGIDASVAADASGNVYFSDGFKDTVQKVPAGCTSSSCVTTLGGDFRLPSGVAADGSGNVYAGDDWNAVKKIPAGCTAPECVITLGDDYRNPEAVAVDASGNVYVGEFSDTPLLKIPVGCTSSKCAITLGGGFKYPTGVAVDSSGNVYIADNGNHALKKVPPGCVSSSCVITLFSGLKKITGLAIDAAGTLYVADGGNSVLDKIPAGCTSSSCITTLGGGFAPALASTWTDKSKPCN